MSAERSGGSVVLRALLLGSGAVLGMLLWLVMRPGPAAPGSGAAAPATAFRPVLSEEQARRLFTLDGRRDVRYDPVAYLTHIPGDTQRWDWPEHPAGSFVRSINNLGFNDDAPTTPAKHGLRVLVAGDSHTGGLVSPSESFTGVAERVLQERLGRADVEVLNAGVGYTSPSCYLDVLHKHLALEPDVFVAVLFAGNDFLEELLIAHFAELSPMTATSDEYYELATRVWKSHEAPFSQGLNQAYRWKCFPAEVEPSRARARDAYREMARVCAAHGIRFLAVLLPTKMDVDEDDRPAWREGARRLGLEEEDVGRSLVVARRLFDELRAAGIECLDPCEEMVRSEEVLYWVRDYHLSLAGNALLGRQLGTRLAPWLGG